MTTMGQCFSDEDLMQVRKDTPGVDGRIHLDNCGSALMAQPVIDEIKSAFEREIAVGGYVAQEQQTDKLSEGYEVLSRLLGGSADDYAFVGSAVDGWTKAFYSLPLQPGDNIVTAYNEYCSNYVAYLQVAKLHDVEIRVAKPAEGGGIDLGHLADLIDARTRLISISQMPSSSGEINQVKDVGQIANEKGILYQLDACQSAGHIPVSADDIGCDIMTGTARKFLRGPRGIGFLYVNEKARSQMEPVVLTNQSAVWSGADEYTLRQDTKVFEAWERSVINQLGFASAIKYLLELGVEKATNQIAFNASYLREKLPTVKGIKVECPPNATSAIITFNKEGFLPSDIKPAMENQNIGVQIASVVHTRLDMEARGIESAVRISPHYYTSQRDMDDFLNALEAL